MCNGPAHANKEEDILCLVVVEDGAVVGNCLARKSNVLARHSTNRGENGIESLVEPHVAARRGKVELAPVTIATWVANALVDGSIADAKPSAVIVLQTSQVHKEVLHGNKIIRRRALDEPGGANKLGEIKRTCHV